jgi:large repetitive protein
MPRFIVLSMLLVGCTAGERAPEETDQDFDGFVATEDCNDLDPEIRPGVSELCDGIDNDCDELIDEDALGATMYFLDSDQDGFGSQVSTVTACDLPDGYAENDDDCNDDDSEIRPDAPERCNETDDDCDEEIDEGAGELYYADKDQDGFGNAGTATLRCEGNPGVVQNDQDCDDDDHDVNPDADEVCDGLDNNCDHEVDDEDDDLATATTWYKDKDGDTFGLTNQTQVGCLKPSGYTLKPDDCDDKDPDVNPAATEVCFDKVDNDCRNGVDDADAIDASVWYLDSDGDTFGDEFVAQIACEAPTKKYVSNHQDCDDTDPDVHPALWWYRDQDIDLFGDPDDGIRSCGQPLGYVSDNTDCDDSTATAYPDAAELCDALDNDCDSVIDEGHTLFDWYRDADDDGFGDPDGLLEACTKPSGYINKNTDCDDTDPDINPNTTWYADSDGDDLGDPLNPFGQQCESPGAAYSTNNDDCSDADVDIGAAQVFYGDNDGDGYGTSSLVIGPQCFATTGYVDNADDCDDTDSALSPETIWYLDGDDDGWGSLPSDPACIRPSAAHVDEDGDCNDLDPNIFPFMTWYFDSDGDGYGDSKVTLATDSCEIPEDGYVSNDLDCDDDDILIHPDTTWYRDDDNDDLGDPNSAYDDQQCKTPGTAYVSNDYDCDDGDASEGSGPEYYLDDDNDGYGDPNNGYPGPVLVAPQCTDPGGDYVADDSDCDDADPLRNPETVWYKDADGDGWGNAAKDFGSEQCDDPGSKWVDNDLDCDDDDEELGSTSHWYVDDDGDGYGDAEEAWPSAECEQPDEDYVDDATDCDDGDFEVNPDTEWYGDSDGDGYGDSNEPFGAAQCDSPGEAYAPNDEDCDDTKKGKKAPVVFTYDSDGDGYGDDATPWAEATCDSPDADYVEDGGDCADEDPSLHPDTLWYHDFDEDGFGDVNDLYVDAQCDAPADHVQDNTDCDDTTSDIGGNRAWYDDTDADGYGDPDTPWPSLSCIEPDSAYIDNDLDCDAGDSTVHPDSIWYADTDGDGYGDATAPHTDVQCTQPEQDHVTDNTDCAVGDSDLHPATEWYVDADDDGYGDEEGSAEGTLGCTGPEEGEDAYAPTSDDCNDEDDQQFPGATEVCNGEDDDCDDDDADAAGMWWDADWSYRVVVDVTAPSFDTVQAPVLVDVDFAAEIAALSGDVEFSADSVRVVTNDCAGSIGVNEVPSQFVDELLGWFEGGSAIDATDNDAGTVVFLHDEDGDLSSDETWTAGAGASFAIYFGYEDADSPTYTVPVGVVVDGDDMTSGDGDFTLSGGMVSSMATTTDEVATRLGNVEANGIRIDGVMYGPGHSNGTVTGSQATLFSGDLVAGISASGDVEAATAETFDYEAITLAFGQNSQFHERIWMEATSTISLSQSGDWTDAIVPVAATENGDSHLISSDIANSFFDITVDANRGVAWTWAVPPAFETGVDLEDETFTVLGNDVSDTGGGATHTLQIGDIILDGAISVFLAHDEDYTSSIGEEDLVAAAEGAAGSVSAGEAW